MQSSEDPVPPLRILNIFLQEVTVDLIIPTCPNKPAKHSVHPDRGQPRYVVGNNEPFVFSFFFRGKNERFIFDGQIISITLSNKTPAGAADIKRSEKKDKQKRRQGSLRKYTIVRFPSSQVKLLRSYQAQIAVPTLPGSAKGREEAV